MYSNFTRTAFEKQEKIGRREKKRGVARLADG